MFTQPFVVLALFTTLQLLGCSDNAAPKVEKTEGFDKISPNDQDNVLLQAPSTQANHIFWKNGDKASKAMLEQSKLLARAVDDLLKIPNKETLFAAQTQWRKTTRKLSALNFYFQLGQAGPANFANFNQTYLRIAAQPIQPGYIDGYQNYPYSGIVHDIGFKIHPESLKQQHQAMDDSEVLLGVYAIQYILFGEDNRTSDDFLAITELNEAHTKSGLLDITEHPINRRRHLLNTQTQVLLSDAQTLASYWEPQKTGMSLEETWNKLPAQTQVRIIESTIETSLATLILNTVEYGKLAIDTLPSNETKPITDLAKDTKPESQTPKTSPDKTNTEIGLLSHQIHYQNLNKLRSEISYISQSLETLFPNSKKPLIPALLNANKHLTKTIKAFKTEHDKGKSLNIQTIRDSFDHIYTAIGK